MTMLARLVGLVIVLAAPCALGAPVELRVATFNLEDVRTEDVTRRDQPRVKRLAEVIQRMRPNIVLLNELAYDMPGAPGFAEGDEPGQNARRFVENYLSVAQAPGLEPVRYRAIMLPTNTGVPSGFDLDNDGRVVTSYPAPPPAGPDGSPGEQTDGGRAYGNDCWGFGTFPGQYGMALLVDERLGVDADAIRTFQLLPWDYMAGAFLPKNPDGTPWFSDEERAIFRLSSKSHWDVPVTLPGGAVLHVLCSHPTPPAFDGPEQRNKRRNHDEIRFWGDYIDGAEYIVDDRNRAGGLAPDASFVILGDLNADPDEGTAFKNPISNVLFSESRINSRIKPTSERAVEGLDPDDTARFRLRADYVLPSADFEVLGSGVWRDVPAGGDDFPSDHFPVWAELRLGR